MRVLGLGVRGEGPRSAVRGEGPRTNVYKPGFQCDAAMALNKKKNIIIVTHYMLKIIKRDSMMTLKREIFFLSNLEYQTNLVEPINLT